jgi:prophage maintenance system killer protein
MTFLSFNNRRIQATDDELFELIVSIASGSLIDIPELAEWIESRTRNWR